MLKRIGKFKKIVPFLFIVLSIINTNNDAFAVSCTKATVTQAGPVVNTKTSIDAEDLVLVTLKNVSGTAVGTWGNNTVRNFYLDPAIANKGLATLLTAFSMEKNVYVTISNTTAETGSWITRVNIK